MTYIDDCTHSRDEFTLRNLIWRYGAERAAEKASGRDPETQADVAKWNALGTSERGAA